MTTKNTTTMVIWIMPRWAAKILHDVLEENAAKIRDMAVNLNANPSVILKASEVRRALESIQADYFTAE